MAWVVYDHTVIDGVADLTGVDVSYNITSVVDDGAGLSTIAWNVDFSGAHYALSGIVQRIGTDEMSAGIRSAPAAGSVAVGFFDAGGAERDPTFCSVIAHGDQ